MNKDIEAPLPSAASMERRFPDRTRRSAACLTARIRQVSCASSRAGSPSAARGLPSVTSSSRISRITGEHLICKTQDVPVGGTHAFTLPGSAVPYILINLGNDEWRAFEQKCTHLSCAVFYQPKEGKIECPCHNGWFDARTGAPLQGPPQRPLPQLQLEVRGDDIFIVPSKHEEHSA